MDETSNRSMTPWLVTSLDPFKLERVVDCVWRQTRRLSSRLAKLLSSRHCRERTGASSHWLRKPLSAQLPEEQCMKVGDANVGSLRFFGKSFGCVQDTRGACKKLNAVRCGGVYYTIKALNDSRHFTYEKHYRALLWAYSSSTRIHCRTHFINELHQMNIDSWRSARTKKHHHYLTVFLMKITYRSLKSPHTSKKSTHGTSSVTIHRLDLCPLKIARSPVLWQVVYIAINAQIEADS